MGTSVGAELGGAQSSRASWVLLSGRSTDAYLGILLAMGSVRFGVKRTHLLLSQTRLLLSRSSPWGRTVSRSCRPCVWQSQGGCRDFTSPGGTCG